MLDLIRDMFLSPGTPEGAYERMAAAWGHAMIGVVLAGLTLWRRPGRPWRGAILAALAYAFTWEAAQIAFAGSPILDSAIDAGAVLCGAIIAASLWTRRLPPVLLSAATALIFLGTRLPERSDHDRGR